MPKRKGMSPTQLSLRWIRGLGFKAQVVEHWVPAIKIRRDLFGCIDILAVGHGLTVGIQSTSSPNLAARITKMHENEFLGTLVESDWILVAQGWKKPKSRWEGRQFRILPGTQEELCQTDIQHPSWRLPARL